MFLKVLKFFLLLFSSWLLVGPLAFMQLGAWSWMIVSYSQESSFQQAIIETFGDERPCDVCKIIDSVEESDAGAPLAQNEQREIKLMLCLSRTIRSIVPAGNYEPATVIVCEPENAPSGVPTPPPRLA